MIIALDVHYRSDYAKAVAINFNDWQSTVVESIHVKHILDIQPYVPGSFYQRELPCLLEVLKELPIANIECIIVDGFVFLSEDEKPGLGYYLYKALDKKIPVIGLAKSAFKNAEEFAVPVLRGESKQALYITSIGIEQSQAAKYIGQMVGPYRMPDLLRELDKETKK
ncbi:MAG: endonuclease V [Bacteroidota bacterium]